MAWNSDLVEAYYRSPNGRKFSFNYDSKLTSETDLKTATYTFPDRNGALVMSLGVGGRRFAFTCFFYGEDCNSKAEQFEKALREQGHGELQHPLYGIHKVVPTGTINRTDDVVAGVGVSSISVVFAETIVDGPIPIQAVKSNSVKKAANKFEKSAVDEFIGDIDLSSAKDDMKLIDGFKKALEIVTGALEGISEAEKMIYDKFQIMQSELYSYVDEFMNAAENAAIHMVKLCRLPSEVIINAEEKIKGYTEAVDKIINAFDSITYDEKEDKNEYVVARLVTETLTTACASGIVETQTTVPFRSRESAVNSALGVLKLFDKVVKFLEKFVGKNYTVEVGEGYNIMRDVVSAAVQEVTENSFSLPTKKVEILSSDRQLVELVFSLYGNLDKLDQFILDNSLNYNELEVVPMGREVCYYVE